MTRRSRPEGAGRARDAEEPGTGDHGRLDHEIAAHYAEVPERQVLRPGGVVAVAAISRFASTLDGLLRGSLDDPAFEAIAERDLREGQHRNPIRRPQWFTTAYFHLPGNCPGRSPRPACR